MDISVWLYRKLLWLYPAAFRREYGPFMVELFIDMRADQGGGVIGLAGFWMRILRDVALSATNERLNRDGGLAMYPDKIDRYEIRAVIGVGSISDIYRAYDPQLEKEVALKVLNRERIEEKWPQDLEAFKLNMGREAKIIGDLDHPAIPKSYDYIETKDQVFFAMDLVPGRDLLAIMEDRGAPLDEAELIDFAVKTCDMLSYVHQQHIIFRDIKPSNIMVDDEGRLYMVDWGIAEEYGGDLAMIGTEGYASPEQYKGHGDPRSDIFSLGASLHHLATGVDPRQQKPFKFDPPHELNPKLSAAFSAIISKALNMEPDDRFQTADDMKAALLACQ